MFIHACKYKTLLRLMCKEFNAKMDEKLIAPNKIMPEIAKIITKENIHFTAMILDQYDVFHTFYNIPEEAEDILNIPANEREV